MVKGIHEQYFLAGSDICQTITFNSTTISQGKFKMQAVVYEMNKVGAELAKKAAAEVTKKEPHRPRFVAGAVGPASPSVEDPSSCNVNFDELVEAYKQQLSGLVDGGVDLLMIETCAAGLVAVEQYFQETKQERLPLMLSATVDCSSGRTLSGESIAEFYDRARQAKPFSIGIKFAVGAECADHIKDVNTGCGHMCFNAGGYEERPALFYTNISDFPLDGILNLMT
ncbi:metH [Symbiodinium natans]|uniref:MetH protein n=1 Tax=Symbiodinium natans TaxID=878477 RepID=A0A812K3T3_9DINO|nr:metH [Symbiodinium natans]